MQFSISSILFVIISMMTVTRARYDDDDNNNHERIHLGDIENELQQHHHNHHPIHHNEQSPAAPSHQETFYKTSITAPQYQSNVGGTKNRAFQNLVQQYTGYDQLSDGYDYDYKFKAAPTINNMYAHRREHFHDNSNAIVSHASNEPSSAPFITLQNAPAGIQYFMSNHRGPAIEYGIPNIHALTRPTLVQSKQRAYAPARMEASKLSHSTVHIPYPPSFISITTARPIPVPYDTNELLPDTHHPEQQDAYHNSRAFRPAQSCPICVPDLFANRQAKSLLDSYIPSWVTAKLLEQRKHNIKTQ